jgi:rifampin ADP-ribosylating transferase
MTSEPVPFEVDESGRLFHGTKADLAPGDLLVPGRASNFEEGRTSNNVYVTGTLDAATWGAELAAGDGPGRIYIVRPLGAVEDDPNVTDKKFPGNPTRSFRTREPVEVIAELDGWVGHSPEKVRARLDSLAELRKTGLAIIED